MKLYRDHLYEYTTYDTCLDHYLQDELFVNLNEQPKDVIENIKQDPLDNKYNASQLAKTGRRGISHGLNRIPAFGAGKIGIESLIGRTAGGEKLSPVQRKLYGLAALLSGITYGCIGLSAYTGDLRLLTPGPICSFIASAATAAGQASIAGDTNAGKIFKTKLLEQIQKIKSYVIKTGEHNIEQTENYINNISDTEANNIVEEVVTDLPKTKADGK